MKLKKAILFILMLVLVFPVFAEEEKAVEAEVETVQNENSEAEIEKDVEVEPEKVEAKVDEKVEEIHESEDEAELIDAAVVVPAVPSKYANNPTGWWNDLWKDAHFSYDLYAKSTLMRGENVPGAGLSMGVETEKFRFEGYGQADYFLKPFGCDGAISKLELSAELGVNLGWKFLEFWAFDVWAVADIGYYTQLVKGLPYPPYDELMVGYSGLMLRPKLLIELKIAKYYGITAGVYYQMPVYPAYSDYSGLGIMVSIC